MVLGQHTETTDSLNDVIEREMSKQEHLFSIYEDISVYVVNWNVKGCD